MLLEARHAGLAHGPNESVPLAEVEVAAGAVAVLALELSSPSGS
jgi:hypothetical protein